SARGGMLVTAMVASEAWRVPCFARRPPRAGLPGRARGLGAARAHGQLVGPAGGASGSVNENSAPEPFRLATAIRPPWASTMPLAIARPRPAPPFLVRPRQ